MEVAWFSEKGWHVNTTLHSVTIQKNSTLNTIRGYIQKFPDWVDKEVNNNKHSLRRNTKGYGGKTR
jgi:hypothetical protein